MLLLKYDMNLLGLTCECSIESVISLASAGNLLEYEYTCSCESIVGIICTCRVLVISSSFVLFVETLCFVGARTLLAHQHSVAQEAGTRTYCYLIFHCDDVVVVALQRFAVATTMFWMLSLW